MSQNELQPKKLPTLQELNIDPIEAFKRDQLKLLLNQSPVASFIKEHPMSKQPYIPIDKVEFMLDRIFQDWKVTVLREGQLFNSVYVTVRLEVKNPLDGNWSSFDGVGAVGIQTDKGKPASDLSAIKQDAVQKALPAAKSYAIKDAADHIGILFGRNLTRKDTIGFSGSYEDPNTIEADMWQTETIETLLPTFTGTEQQKEKINNDMKLGMTKLYAAEVISLLRENQIDRIGGGMNYSQTDIKKQVAIDLSKPNN